MDTTEIDALDRADMTRLVAGHEAALDDIMDRHAKAVFHFLCRMLGGEEEAEDLAQETFVRVYRARDSYRSTHRFSTWLFTIAANLARNRLRWRHRHPNVSLEAESPSTGQSLGDTLPGNEAPPHADIQAAERAAHVRAAVAALPVDLREAITLCEWEEMAVADAARVLRCTPKAVESRLYRARQILRDRLARWL
ncbi:MAG: RNA polymerase sigma factor [Verrucomicrobiae bacterium]|nr:RNA polymerase sigma factor [Verrucomicrobiae bacterium]